MIPHAPPRCSFFPETLSCWTQLWDLWQRTHGYCSLFWGMETWAWGVSFPIHVLSDHKNLECFMTTKALSRHEAMWSECLSRFNFKIFYQLGKITGKADALTRRSWDFPSSEDKRLIQQSRVILKPENFFAYTSCRNSNRWRLRNVFFRFIPFWYWWIRPRPTSIWHSIGWLFFTPFAIIWKKKEDKDFAVDLE